MQTRRMRLLREKHSIPILELGRHCDASPQRLTQIELGMGTVTTHMNRLVETAFSRLIESRKQELASLEADFQKYRKSLLDFIDEREGAV